MLAGMLLHMVEAALPVDDAGNFVGLHGYGYLHEACVQLWGEGGERQVTKPLQVAAVGAGGGNTCGCLLLTKGI